MQATAARSALTAQRADARRNRDRILSAARAAFVDSEDADVTISMAEISRRAGVGMATLYRNFPSRRELLEALYAAEVDVVCEQARTASGATPGAALRAWLRQAFAFASNKKHIAAELLTHRSGDHEVFDDNRARVIAASRPLFAAAQQTREVRSDLTLEQTLDMLVSIAAIGGGSRYQEPILQTVLDGLSPPGAPDET